MASCTVKNDKVENFRYLIDEFADWNTSYPHDAGASGD